MPGRVEQTEKLRPKFSVGRSFSEREGKFFSRRSQSVGFSLIYLAKPLANVVLHLICLAKPLASVVLPLICLAKPLANVVLLLTAGFAAGTASASVLQLAKQVFCRSTENQAFYVFY